MRLPNLPEADDFRAAQQSQTRAMPLGAVARNSSELVPESYAVLNHTAGSRMDDWQTGGWR
jgi:hypothetical protein